MQVLKQFNSQSFYTRAKKGEQLVSMMLANKNTFVLMGDDIPELNTKNESLINKPDSYDEKWMMREKRI